MKFHAKNASVMYKGEKTLRIINKINSKKISFRNSTKSAFQEKYVNIYT